MYLESWLIAIALIAIIYLAWRLYSIKANLSNLALKLTEYQKNKELLESELCHLLILEDSRFLKKASEKTVDKVLTDQARDIWTMFKNHYTQDFTINGTVTGIEDPPNVRLAKILDNIELQVFDDDTMAIDEIKYSLKKRMEEYK